MSTSLILSGIFATSMAKEIIVTTTSSIYGMIFSIISYEYIDISKKIKDIDIEKRIKIIEAFISDLDQDKLDSQKSQQLAINDVYESVVDIHNNLENIQNKCESHKSSWFYYFYKLDCSKEIQNLHENYNILNSRFDILIKIITVL